MMILRAIGLTILVAIAALVVQSFGDILRYLKMRQM